MSLLVVGVFSVVGALIAWELAARVWRWLRRSTPANERRHHMPEEERRRLLDLRASRWPGPARW